MLAGDSMNTIAQTTGKSTQSFSLWRGKYHLAPLMLRLVIGYGFMVHGWAKLTSGPANFEKLLIPSRRPF